MFKKISIVTAALVFVFHCGKIKDVYRSLTAETVKVDLNQAINGKVVFLKGKLSINGAVAKLGAPVKFGDKLKTAKKSRAAIQVAGKNVIMMHPKSNLTFEVKRREGLFKVSRGALSAVIKNRDVVKGFKVQTPTAVAGVRGTTLFVKSIKKKKRTYACVCNGKVHLKTPEGKSQLIQSGHHKAFWYAKKGDKINVKDAGMKFHDDNSQQELAKLVNVTLKWQEIN